MFSIPSRVGLGIVAAIGLISGAIGADDLAKEKAQLTKFADQFKDEPVRPKSRESILFLDSLDKAKSDAAVTKRRIFVYFTGPGCGWCRMLEARTFTDAEVVELSRKYVCVELHTDRDGGARRPDAY